MSRPAFAHGSARSAGAAASDPAGAATWRAAQRATADGRVTPTRIARSSRPGGGPLLRLLDQLARRGELRVAPLELAVQLPAAQLAEDLPHARRLAEAELREVAAADL